MNATAENAMGSSTLGCEPDCFLPSTVTIGVGGMVTFANNEAHTSTSGVMDQMVSGISFISYDGRSIHNSGIDAGEYPYLYGTSMDGRISNCN